MTNDLHPLSNFIIALETILSNMVFEHYIKNVKPELNSVSNSFIKERISFSPENSRSARPTLLGWYKAQSKIR